MAQDTLLVMCPEKVNIHGIAAAIAIEPSNNKEDFMLRHIALLLLLSFALLFLMHPLQWLVGKLYQFELFFAELTGQIFANGLTGRIIRQVITLTLTPLIIASIPAGIYWLLRRHTLPYLSHLVWTIWLMLVLILACHK